MAAITGTTHEVKMIGDAQGYRFEPANITIKAGDGIKFVTVSGGPHNVAFDPATIPADQQAQLDANISEKMGQLSSALKMNAGESVTVSFANIKPGKEAASLAKFPPPQDHLLKTEDAFAQKYKAKFGSQPTRLATLAYDAVSLAGALARGGGPDPFSLQALTNVNGFNGADGVFRFRSDGWNERGLAVMEIDNNAAVVISPAPRSFAGG